MDHGETGVDDLNECTELEALIGIEFGPEYYDIEKGMVERYIEATGDHDPRWKEETPPTFTAALVHKEIVHRIFNADVIHKRTLNGANELEYADAIRIGDRIAVTAVVESVKKVQGKLGMEIFAYTSQTYTNQHGDIVARGRNTYIKF